MAVFLDCLAILLAYLIGAIPTGLIIARKAKNIDIREHGSKNIGATNVWRVLGWRFGLLTFAIDVGKALSAVVTVPLIAGGVLPEIALFAALAVLLGNFFNVFLGFKGGKGVAASLGVFLALAPLPTIAALLAFIVVVWVTDYISIGSITAAILLPCLVYAQSGPVPLFWLLLLICTIVILKHHKNIRRLIEGTEGKFRKKSIPQES